MSQTDVILHEQISREPADDLKMGTYLQNRVRRKALC